METKIRCKKCGHDKFIRTSKPPIPMGPSGTEFREFACAKCGELIYYECPLTYTPEYDSSTGLTSYHDVIEDVPDFDTEYEDILAAADKEYDDDNDGGFDPGIG